MGQNGQTSSGGKKIDGALGIPTKPSVAGSPKALTAHPLGNIRDHATVLPGDAGTQDSAGSALLQQRGLAAQGSWALPA